MTNKDKYRELCKREKNIPVFSKDWYLDSVCIEGNWDVIIIEKSNQIIAAMPYYLKNKYGIKYITQPQLTQTNGLWIKYPENQKYSSRLSYEKKIMSEVIDQIENLKIANYNQSYHYSFTNWLPFYWRGFSQTTYYTYVIENLSNIETLFNNFDHAKRKNINKAQKMVSVQFDLSAKDFYENHELTLSKQNQKILYSWELFSNLYAAAYSNRSGKTIYAIDDKKNIHGALFIVWDSESAYDLISTIDPEYRNSGAASLLVFEALKYLQNKVKRFDFEGSMIENVENSFRQFGSVQKPYFLISKTYSKLIKIKNAIENLR